VLPEGARALLDDRAFATVATLEPDGRPQMSVVWVERDGDDVLFSTTKDRRKHANLSRDPRATLLCFPLADPYTYLEVRGVVGMSDDPHSELISRLSGRYLGRTPYDQDPPGTERVVCRLRPERVVWSG